MPIAPKTCRTQVLKESNHECPLAHLDRFPCPPVGALSKQIGKNCPVDGKQDVNCWALAALDGEKRANRKKPAHGLNPAGCLVFMIRFDEERCADGLVFDEPVGR
jgi:hypothetical protein